MFSTKGITYSEAGYLLQNKTTKQVCFQEEGMPEEFDEIVIDLADIQIVGGIALISNGLIADIISNEYDTIKTNWVKKRYSNDDQISIMLNHGRSEEHTLIYEKMQEWRSFASQVARSIITKLEEEKNTQLNL